MEIETVKLGQIVSLVKLVLVTLQPFLNKLSIT
jgi:hypothetical protein